MFNLLSLPYEVLSNIIANINFDDVFNLGLSCKALKYLLTEESICRLIVQNKIPFCNEALSNKYTAGLSASALRRVAKRREAFATANPYSVATIGFGDAYLYCKGVLCYTLDDQLRVLNLHDSACREAVVSIPGMLRSAISENACNTKGVFQLLYCSDSIISCVYKTSGLDANSWLIAFSIETSEVLVVRELDSVERLFVRHDAQYLYYENGSTKKVRLSDMVGSEIGSTVCFEFDNGYFYALSNQTSFEVEEIDWTSFYHCIRFPLASPCEELTEKTKNHSMWRRQHEEGPIDDRWTNLRLDTDENTGELRIIESRKEWYHGASRSQRTYYTTPIVFPSTFYDTDDDLYFAADASFSSVATAACSVISAGSSSSTNTQSSTSEDCSSYASRDLSAYPDDPLLRLLRKDDNPNYMPSQKRLPNLSTQATMVQLIKHLHSPNPDFDITTPLRPHFLTSWMTLFLQIGKKIKDYDFASDPEQSVHPSCPEPNVQAIRYYILAPAQDPEVANESLDELYKLLNPPSHLGNVEGTADERSLVFDPAIKLAGLKRWGGMTRKGVGEGPHIDGRANGHTFDVSAQVEDTGLRDPQMMCGDIMESDVTIGIVRKGKGKETETEAEKCSHKTATAGAADASGHTYFNTHETPDSSTAKASWMWHEKAMYQDIGLGYYFGKDRKPAVVNGGEKGRHTLFTS
ncbi:F-box domain-containing protein [Botrytis cinerea]